MAFGLPIITTLVGSIPTVVHPGENCPGGLVGQPAAIAEAVLLSGQDQDLEARLAANARADAARIMGSWRRTHAAQVGERIHAGCPLMHGG